MSDKNDKVIVNFGPQHPATHGVLNLSVELDGEVIQAITPNIGFLHRGTEKLIEHKTYLQALPYFDRLDYVSPMSQEHCFSLAVEKMLKCEIPKRGQYIRVLFLEITRVLNHLLNITTLALDVGAMTPLLWMFEEREKIMEIYEDVSGARMHAIYIRPGGVANDIEDNILEKINKIFTALPSKIDDIEVLLTENRIFKQRLMDIGSISKKDAIQFGFSGPMIRACGIPWDLRKSNPYEVYSELDFKIPVGKNGDCYDRYIVRVAEVRESIKIIMQCLNKMPSGDYNSSDLTIVPPIKKNIEHSMEAMIHHFKLYTEGYTVPEGEIYVATETPKGEFGVYIISDGRNTPYRCRIRAPGFAHLQALEHMSKGYMIADMVANLGSIDIVLGEIDR